MDRPDLTDARSRYSTSNSYKILLLISLPLNKKNLSGPWFPPPGPDEPHWEEPHAGWHRRHHRYHHHCCPFLTPFLQVLWMLFSVRWTDKLKLFWTNSSATCNHTGLDCTVQWVNCTTTTHTAEEKKLPSFSNKSSIYISSKLLWNVAFSENCSLTPEQSS